MVIKVLISADSKKRRPFINCIKKICDDSEGKYKCHFLSDELADLKEENRLKRMFESLRDAHIILMDVTPLQYTFETLEPIEKDWITNQGVLIEYGAIMATESLWDHLKLFCESAVERSQLHPYFLKTVDQYSEKDVDNIDDPKSLKNMVINIIKKFEDRMDEEYLILKRNSIAYKGLLKKLLTDSK